VEHSSLKMKDQDLELEKVRLISLATKLGFDEDSAKKCLDRFVDLYGTKIQIKILETYALVIDCGN